MSITIVYTLHNKKAMLYELKPCDCTVGYSRVFTEFKCKPFKELKKKLESYKGKITLENINIMLTDIKYIAKSINNKSNFVFNSIAVDPNWSYFVLKYDYLDKGF